MPNATNAAPTVATYQHMIVTALRAAAAVSGHEDGMDAELLCEACGLTCCHDDPAEVENFTLAMNGLESTGVIAFVRGDWRLSN